MGLFDKLFGKANTINWEEIRETEIVYPKSSVSLLALSDLNGEVLTGWIDLAYEAYEFKKYCPVNFLIKIDLTDEIAAQNPDLDMGYIEDFILEESRKFGIAHMVARLTTDKGMNIEMYADNAQKVLEHLWAISQDTDRLFTFEIDANKDAKWSAFSQLVRFII
jgi:hypothetical protein